MSEQITSEYTVRYGEDIGVPGKLPENFLETVFELDKVV